MAEPPPLDTEPPCATTQEMSSQAASAPSTASDANGRSHDSELQDAYVRGGIDMAARQFDLMRSEFSAQRERDLAHAYQRGLEHGRRGTSERSVAGNDDNGPSSQHRVQSFQRAAARPEPENISDGRRQQAPEETLLSIGRRTIDQRRDARPLRESQPMFSERQRTNIRATFQGLLNTGPARASRPSWPSARHPIDLRAQAAASGRPSAPPQLQRESDLRESQQGLGAAPLHGNAAIPGSRVPAVPEVLVAAGGLQIQPGQTQMGQQLQPAPPGSASAPDAQPANLEGRRRRCRGKGSERRRKAARALQFRKYG